METWWPLAWVMDSMQYCRRCQSAGNPTWLLQVMEQRHMDASMLAAACSLQLGKTGTVQ